MSSWEPETDEDWTGSKAHCWPGQGKIFLVIGKSRYPTLIGMFMYKVQYPDGHVWDLHHEGMRATEIVAK